MADGGDVALYLHTKLYMICISIFFSD